MPPSDQQNELNPVPPPAPNPAVTPPLEQTPVPGVQNPAPQVIAASQSAPQVVGPTATPQPQAVQPITGTSMASVQQQQKKSKMVKLVAIATAALVVVLIAGFFGYQKFAAELALEEYKGSGFSVLVPKGYSKEEADGAVFFKQPGVEEDKQSGVIVGKVFGGIGGKDVQVKAMDEFEKNIGPQMDKLAGISKSMSVKDVKTTRTKHKGLDALHMTAQINEGESKVGNFEAVFVMNDTGDLYALMILSHKSTPGLVKQSGKIIDSFELN